MTKEWLKWNEMRCKRHFGTEQRGSGVIVHPLCQNKSIHWMMEWQENDLNDTGMTGMSMNDGMITEWWNDKRTTKWHKDDWNEMQNTLWHGTEGGVWGSNIPLVPK